MKMIWSMAATVSFIALYWAAASFESCAIGFGQALAVICMAGAIAITAAMKLDKLCGGELRCGGQAREARAGEYIE